MMSKDEQRRRTSGHICHMLPMLADCFEDFAEGKRNERPEGGLILNWPEVVAVLRTAAIYVSQAQEWISVNDRLPQEWQRVLVCNVAEEWTTAADYRERGWTMHGEGIRPPTHWMPLPAPPETSK